jgi:hypothetical protein
MVWHLSRLFWQGLNHFAPWFKFQKTHVKVLSLCGWDKAEGLERLTSKNEVATVLDSISASSDTVESERWQMKFCRIKSTEKIKKKRFCRKKDRTCMLWKASKIDWAPVYFYHVGNTEQENNGYVVFKRNSQELARKKSGGGGGALLRPLPPLSIPVLEFLYNLWGLGTE